MSIDRWMDNDMVYIYIYIYIYIYMEYFSVIKKWNNAICSNMDGPRDGHTEWTKSDTERQTS